MNTEHMEGPQRRICFEYLGKTCVGEKWIFYIKWREVTWTKRGWQPKFDPVKGSTLRANPLHVKGPGRVGAESN
jgi:hypothetical protein